MQLPAQILAACEVKAAVTLLKKKFDLSFWCRCLCIAHGLSIVLSFQFGMLLSISHGCSIVVADSTCLMCWCHIGGIQEGCNWLQQHFGFLLVPIHFLFSQKCAISLSFSNQIVISLCQTQERDALAMQKAWHFGRVSSRHTMVVRVSFDVHGNSLLSVWANTFHADMTCSFSTHHTHFVTFSCQALEFIVRDVHKGVKSPHKRDSFFTKSSFVRPLESIMLEELRPMDHLALCCLVETRNFSSPGCFL